jgi:hypothetical protein
VQAQEDSEPDFDGLDEDDSDEEAEDDDDDAPELVEEGGENDKRPSKRQRTQ